MSKLGQIFYGRGKDGYGVLGVSPSGRPFSDSVAALCRAVGSPDRPGDVRPFLISKRERGHVIMIRACRDEDSSGRATLFFHVLVAKEAELASAGLDAFVLAERGAFVSSLPDGSVNDILFPSSENRSVTPCSPDVRFPAFIAADHPLDAEVRRVLGRETLSRNWATYSYNPLQGFDLCVYSSYGASPTNGNRYSFVDGRFVAASVSRPTSPTPQSPTHAKDRSLMLKASLLLNAVLVAVLVAVFTLRNGNEKVNQPTSSPGQNAGGQSVLPKTDPAPEMTKDEAFKKWGAEWENAYLQKLRLLLEKELGGHQLVSDFGSAFDAVANPNYKNTQLPDDVRVKYETIRATFKACFSLVKNCIINQQPKSNER